MLRGSGKEGRPRKKALRSDTRRHKQALGYARGLSATRVKQLCSPPAAAQKPARRRRGNKLRGSRGRDRATGPGDGARPRDTGAGGVAKQACAGGGGRGRGARPRGAAGPGRRRRGWAGPGAAPRPLPPVAALRGARAGAGAATGVRPSGAEAAGEEGGGGGRRPLPARWPSPPRRRPKPERLPQLSPRDGGRREPKSPRPPSAARGPAPAAPGGARAARPAAPAPASCGGGSPGRCGAAAQGRSRRHQGVGAGPPGGLAATALRARPESPRGLRSASPDRARGVSSSAAAPRRGSGHLLFSR